MGGESRVRSIRSAEDLKEIEESIRSAAANATRSLQELLTQASPMDAMAAMKFHAIGFDPLSGNPQNLVEQLNQMFTYLGSCAAVRYLLDKHPGSAPFTMNLGIAPGPDIISEDGQVVAEVFTATHPGSNDKLRRDVRNVHSRGAQHAYVFYSCRGFEAGERTRLASAPEVNIVSLGALCPPLR